MLTLLLEVSSSLGSLIGIKFLLYYSVAMIRILTNLTMTPIRRDLDI